MVTIVMGMNPRGKHSKGDGGSSENALPLLGCLVHRKSPREESDTGVRNGSHHGQARGRGW